MEFVSKQPQEITCVERIQKRAAKWFFNIKTEEFAQLYRELVADLKWQTGGKKEKKKSEKQIMTDIKNDHSRLKKVLKSISVQAKMVSFAPISMLRQRLLDGGFRELYKGSGDRLKICFAVKA